MSDDPALEDTRLLTIRRRLLTLPLLFVVWVALTLVMSGWALGVAIIVVSFAWLFGCAYLGTRRADDTP